MFFALDYPLFRRNSFRIINSCHIILFSEIFICEFCVTWSYVFSLFVACLFRTDINVIIKSENSLFFISIFSNCLLILYIFIVCCRVHLLFVCFRLSFFLKEVISNYLYVSYTFSEIFIREFCIACSYVFSLFVACLFRTGINALIKSENSTLFLSIFSNSLLSLYILLASVLDKFWLLFLWFLQSLDYFHSSEKINCRLFLFNYTSYWQVQGKRFDLFICLRN